MFICGSILATHAEARSIEDEIIYFVMPDRFANGDPSNDTGGIEGDRTRHGFDPTDKGFYHGGDLKGLAEKLDYIAGLGATAIWMTPVFVNKPVQGPPESPSAGYHGYWITDFTEIDPHLGTRKEFGDLVAQAHARGLKIIMDIVINHTADVIQYHGCNRYNDQADVYWSECEYRPIAEFPYITRGGPGGDSINAGFQGDGPEHRNAENFARLTDPNYAYEVFVPAREADVKVPGWLNDPIHYHNRGNSHWEGESSLYGDFAGLDDVFTEHPRVVDGMIDIYTAWIDEFGIDGYRVDTARHVNDGFWRQFNPAILAAAKARGVCDFYLFGEAYDPRWRRQDTCPDGVGDFYLFGEAYEPVPERAARFTTEAAFPAVLDFAFAHAAQGVITGRAGPAALAAIFARDDLYRGDPRGAGILPTFIGNHDDGRIGHFLIEALGPDADGDELLARSILGHALMLFSRGVPVIYYGDEQGFTGDGRDQDAREDMFASRVASYNDNRLIGSDITTSDDNFDRDHPLYRAIAEMARVRAAEPTLRRGEQKALRADAEPGILAFTRRASGDRTLVVFNSANTPRDVTMRVDTCNGGWQVVYQQGLKHFESDGRDITVELAPLSFAVFRTAN